jgi:hypothetical protein
MAEKRDAYSIFVGKRRRNEDNLEDLGLGGMCENKMDLAEVDWGRGGVWSELTWLRTGTGGIFMLC